MSNAWALIQEWEDHHFTKKQSGFFFFDKGVKRITRRVLQESRRAYSAFVKDPEMACTGFFVV